MGGASAPTGATLLGGPPNPRHVDRNRLPVLGAPGHGESEQRVFHCGPRCPALGVHTIGLWAIDAGGCICTQLRVGELSATLDVPLGVGRRPAGGRQAAGRRPSRIGGAACVGCPPFCLGGGATLAGLPRVPVGESPSSRGLRRLGRAVHRCVCVRGPPRAGCGARGGGTARRRTARAHRRARPRRTHCHYYQGATHRGRGVRPRCAPKVCAQGVRPRCAPQGVRTLQVGVEVCAQCVRPHCAPQGMRTREGGSRCAPKGCARVRPKACAPRREGRGVRPRGAPQGVRTPKGGLRCAPQCVARHH